MSIFKNTKLEESKDEQKELVRFSFPSNVSMKTVGDSIEGIYQGCLIKFGKGLNNGDLVVAAFLQPDESIQTCVCGTQIKRFLESFQRGYFLRITRTQTMTISGDRKFAQYSFEHDPAGIKESNEINFLDASDIPISNDTKKIKLVS